jgi:hypothetical protein
MKAASYILPIRAASLAGMEELTAYLIGLGRAAPWLALIVVDNSPGSIFSIHHRLWDSGVMHLRPDPIFCPNGKVRGVMTGLRIATTDKLIIADDDVQYGLDALQRVLCAVESVEVVRPQNYFNPGLGMRS